MTLGALDSPTAGRGPLARCAGDPAAFLERDWGRRASVVTGVDARRFDDLLSLDDVDRFLTTTALRTPFFRVVKAGEQIPEADYTRSGRTGSRDVGGMVDPARLATLFEGGATIVLQGLHRWSEPVTRFTRDLELELGHPCQVNAYLTPPGAQGLALHQDPHDVFVLQAFGRKRWEVHAAPREQPRDPIVAEVGPGDSIYLPTGTPHAASTQDVVSGHLTVGVHVTPWSDVVGAVVAGLVDRIDDPVPAQWTGDLETFARDLRTHLRSLADELQAVDASEEAERRFERFLSHRSQLARGTISERSVAIEIADSTVLFHRPGTPCELRVRGDVLVVLLGDRRLEMPAWLEPAMRKIADVNRFAVGDLAGVLPGAEHRAVLARRLVREGLLTARNAG